MLSIEALSGEITQSIFRNILTYIDLKGESHISSHLSDTLHKQTAATSSVKNDKQLNNLAIVLYSECYN